MKIQGDPRVYGVYQQSIASNKTGTNNKAEDHTDQVALSSQARDFQQIRSVISDVPDVRAERVSELTGRINSGTYNVTSANVADKILSRLVI